ncbi:MAG: hypothetical protein IPM40_07325 [Gammaproteobacteria bacterium]|nr:hypothetical protein [Gammaproteobacteria bacterium]
MALAYAIVYMPTLALANAVCFARCATPRRSSRPCGCGHSGLDRRRARDQLRVRVGRSREHRRGRVATPSCSRLLASPVLGLSTASACRRRLRCVSASRSARITGSRPGPAGRPEFRGFLLLGRADLRAARVLLPECEPVPRQAAWQIRRAMMTIGRYRRPASSCCCRGFFHRLVSGALLLGMFACPLRCRGVPPSATPASCCGCCWSASRCTVC